MPKSSSSGRKGKAYRSSGEGGARSLGGYAGIGQMLPLASLNDYFSSRCLNRKLLVTTLTELMAMAAAARIG